MSEPPGPLSQAVTVTIRQLNQLARGFKRDSTARSAVTQSSSSYPAMKPRRSARKYASAATSSRIECVSTGALRVAADRFDFAAVFAAVRAVLRTAAGFTAALWVDSRIVVMFVASIDLHKK
jgi:hypothetical protein